MCGIVGFVGKQPAAPILLKGLEKLEYRGYDSAGLAVISGDSMRVVKTVGRIEALKTAARGGEDVPGCVGIGHTRWATHGAPSQVNAHPHTSGANRFAVVHNGIIENYLELRRALADKGFVFQSETDTEVIVHLIADFYTGDLLEAVHKAVAQLQGSFAVGVLCTEHPGLLIAAKKDNPLIVGLSDDGNLIASDVTALVERTKSVVYLEDGEIAALQAGGVSFYGEDGRPRQKQVEQIDWNIDAAEKGGYRHFMMKEIIEQPQAFRRTIEPRVRGGAVEFEGLSLTAEDLKRMRRIVITACGSSYHVGMVGKYVLEEMLRVPVEVDLASEFRYRNPLIDRDTLVIVISQSGETADTLAALREAKTRGARVLAIVNVVGSSIAKASDDVIYTWAGPEIAVATTKAYSTQIAVLYLFSIYAARLLDTVGAQECAQLLQELSVLPEKMQSIFSQADAIRSLAERFYDKKSIFFIGRNIDYAVALEGSLKLKEISYIHSEAYAAGELKHGTISLIDEGRLVVALACREALFDKMLSNIKEVKARGATVLATAAEGNTAILDEADKVLFLPRVHPLLTASVEVIPLQLFAYYVADFNGCDIDKPRNLAKSVTVE